VKRIIMLACASLLLGCSGVSKLDWSTLGRDTWQRPADVVDALRLGQGDCVADLGAGEGYFVEHLSLAVGSDGTVYAVEVDDERVAGLSERFPPDATNVEAVRGAFEDPNLPDGTIDVVLIVNTYHHIEDRPGYFRRLRQDLKPGGRVAVIEPNEDLGGILSLALDEGHTSSAPTLEQEMQEAGYVLDGRHDFLPVQIFRVFSPGADAG
jgi:ubiquinone/menaquinone biosynthesis C-methylase UbiE